MGVTKNDRDKRMPMKQTEFFKYLGSRMSKDRGSVKEIKKSWNIKD